jgi:hypothetical protein
MTFGKPRRTEHGHTGPDEMQHPKAAKKVDHCAKHQQELA